MGKTCSTHGRGKAFIQYLEGEPQWKRPLGKCENLKSTSVTNFRVRGRIILQWIDLDHKSIYCKLLWTSQMKQEITYNNECII